MKQLVENLWVKTYPLSVLGTHHGRTLTILPVASGRLVLHSMAPFSSSDLAEIRALGEPSWLVEAMMLHDTYARQGHDSFPGVPFLAPEGFQKVVNFAIQPLLPAPVEWSGELEVFPVVGVPSLKEHLFLHVPSRTLIVADLLFNFAPDEKGWDHFLPPLHRWHKKVSRH